MAAPTNAANVKKALANPEPSTHGPKQTCDLRRSMSAHGGEADSALARLRDVRSLDPFQTSVAAPRRVRVVGGCNGITP